MNTKETSREGVNLWQTARSALSATRNETFATSALFLTTAWSATKFCAHSSGGGLVAAMMIGGVLVYGHNKLIKRDGANRTGTRNYFFRKATNSSPNPIINQPESVIAATSEGFFAASLDGLKILEANPSFCRMVGYSKENLIGMSLEDFCCSSNKAVCRQTMSLLPSSKHSQCEVEIKTRQGRCLQVKISASLLSEGADEKIIFAFVSDITQHKNYTKALEYQALHDEATNLPNRASLNLFLEEALSSAVGGRSTVVFLLDLDDFKHYNDALGHPFGDMILASAAGRLQGFCQHDCQVARVGGDEFAIVAAGMSQAEAQTFASRVSSVIREKTVLAGQHIFTSASIGIAMAPEHGSTAEDLMKRADMAMYSAKKGAKGGYCIFSYSMEAETQQKLAMNASLRGAMLNNDFYLLYQPQVDILTGKIIGVEALLRLKNNGTDLTKPAHFIPALEESGLIIPVGEWVLTHAIQRLAKWESLGHACRMSINISTKQFKDPTFAQRVISAIQCEKANPSLVCIEITESTLMEDIELAKTQLTELAAFGISVSIDDFGTGHSSLKYLQELPVNEIKIDQSFVRGISSQSDDTIIVKTIAKLGQSLGLQVVAEGVESACHIRQLQEFGATYGQGFFYSHPLSEGEILLLLNEKAGSDGSVIPAELSCPCRGHDKKLPACLHGFANN
ncbi:EAL domain-containing protein (plasmid) [Trichlorobacter lovleyi]|uniref:sensor domain-containing protein n=1 Tax=Trichlorobacter lovleyi TaxID=313985 RepID=UPI00223FFAFE|nr:EAL domain-containing protein [Trichlorobacter lovleyi]QOX80773.1 EAL domain-containing protein [Trichlorobacter lovleyi]